jgi:hypothetical protein
MTPPAAADTLGAKRHVSQLLGAGDGVKGRSRRLPVREAQPLRPSPVPSTMKQPCDRPHQGIALVAAVAAGWLDRGERVEVQIDDRLQGLCGRRALKRVGQRFEPGGIGSL